MLARFIGYLGGAVAFWLFTRRRESRNAAPYHSLGRRVVRDAVAFPENSTPKENADTPDGTTPGDEQVNGFHEAIRAWEYTKENDR